MGVSGPSNYFLMGPGGVPHKTLKWGSKELTTSTKYRVFGAT